MEYVPMNIKQEVEAATSASLQSEGNTTTSINNNNSSQAHPDSVENKVSTLNITREMGNYQKNNEFHAHFLPVDNI